MAIFQSLKENWEHYSEQIKIFIFGENNSRLDKIISRFYSMRSEKRKRVRIYSMIGGIVLFVLIIGYYFYGIMGLQSNLNQATNAYLEVEEFKPSFNLVQTEYLKISSKIAPINQASSLIPAIQDAALKMNVQVSKFGEESPIITNLPPTSVLKSEFQKAKIDFQVNSISIKHLTKFLNELHKLPNKFILTKLEIKQLKKDKLYFDSSITVEAFIPLQNSPKRINQKG